VAERLFVFVQFEFPWELGPADGRYLLRGGPDAEPERVVVFGALDSRRPLGTTARTPGPIGRRLARRRRPAPPDPDPAPVRTSRVTVIDPVPLAAEAQARAWLAGLDAEHETLAAAAVVNRVLHSHRVASADPYAREVSPAQALVIRAGFGEGEDVAVGAWIHAQELPWSPARRGARRERTFALRPQERLAALLGGRGAELACEDLVLRARLDVDHGRLRAAALQLDAAYSAALAELDGEQRQDLAIRLGELRKLQPQVREQSETALAGGAEPERDVVEHALGRLEAALRARSAAGLL
jgi:hypothetical protein